MQGKQVPANSNTLNLLEVSPDSPTKINLWRYGLGVPKVSATTPKFSSPNTASIQSSRSRFPTWGGQLCWTILGFSNLVRPYQTFHCALSQTRVPTSVVINLGSHIPFICSEWNDLSIVYPHASILSTCPRHTMPQRKCQFGYGRTRVQILALPLPSCSHNGDLSHLSEFLLHYPQNGHF